MVRLLLLPSQTLEVRSEPLNSFHIPGSVLEMRDVATACARLRLAL